MTEQSIEQVAARRLEQERAEAEESRLRELAAEEQQRREAERRERERQQAAEAAREEDERLSFERVALEDEAERKIEALAATLRELAEVDGATAVRDRPRANTCPRCSSTQSCRAGSATGSRTRRTRAHTTVRPCESATL